MVRSRGKSISNFRRLLAACFAGAALCGGSLHAQGQGQALLQPQDIADKIVERFQTYNTYRADFEELNHKTLKQGMFMFEKPNNLYIAYLEKGKKVVEVFVNSSHMHIYLKRLHIVFEESLALESPDEPDDLLEPFDDLQGVFESPWNQLSRLTNRYNFNFARSRGLANLVGPSEAALFRGRYSSQVYHLNLTPKKVDMGLKQLELWVSPEGDVLRSRSIAFNNRRLDLVLYNIELNPVLPPKSFEFVLPPNVQVFRNSLIKKVPRSVPESTLEGER